MENPLINWNNIQNPYLNRPIEVILPNEITDSHLNFRNFEKPEDWKFDFLKDLSDFGMSKIFDKFSKYWIFGEALDWKLLSVNFISHHYNHLKDEIEQWLDFSDPLGGFTEEEIKNITNAKIYRSIVSFYYGVIVERALIIDIQEKCYKNKISSGIYPNENSCNFFFVDLYGLSYSELCTQYNNFFLDESNKNFHRTISDENRFTYWLFKYRISNSEPEKLASDTRRGLDRLMTIKSSHFKRISNKILNNKLSYEKSK